MSSTTNGILNQAKPDHSASTARMNLLVAACDYLRNSYPTPGDQTPMIPDDSALPGVAATAAILVAANGAPFVHESQLQKILKDEQKKIAQEELVLAARWHMLFSVPETDVVTPPILENPPAPGVCGMAALLRASEPYNPYDIWNPFSEEQLERGATQFYADLSNIGKFDKSASLDSIASLMLQNRPLTRTELILAMKCDYIAKHRAWAISVDFNFGPLMRTFRRRCGYKECPCVCASIEPNYMFS
jgi:hypothetical protein